MGKCLGYTRISSEGSIKQLLLRYYICLSFSPNITSKLSVSVSAFFTFMLIAANTVVNVSVNNNNNNNNNNQERVKIETFKN